MDIEKLIKRIKCPQIQSCPMDREYPSCKACQKSMQQEVITTLSTLQGENEKLKRALAEMWFVYVNKDGEIPHTYEEEAVELAQEILGPWGECMPKYLWRGPHKED